MKIFYVQFCVFLVAQRWKRLPAMWETRVLSLGWEAPLETEMATYSSILAWRIPWREEPNRLQSTGSQRVGHNWATSLSVYSCHLLISSASVRSILFLSVRDLSSDMSFICLRFNDSNKLESFSESTFQRKKLKDSCLSRFPEPFDNKREYGISQFSDCFYGSLKPTTVFWSNTQN